MTARKEFHIGCQSWQYADWVTEAAGDTVFYPRGTKSPEMLSLYSKVFDTIEVDSTAYGTPAISTLEGWRTSTPDNFLFSLKVPRAITHEFSLGTASHGLMQEFIDAAKHLGPKLGTILIQLPAVFESTKENGQNLRDFLRVLPDTVKFAVEFRHPGWFVDWTFEELNERGIALALVAGKWIPQETMFAAFERTATPFAYVRMMGIRDLPRFDRIYRDRLPEIREWATQIEELSAAEVYIYVDNYFEGLAPATASRMAESLGLPAVDPRVLEPQASLF